MSRLIIPFKLFVYVEDKKDFYEIDKIPQGFKSTNISGTELRKGIKYGLNIWVREKKYIG